MAKKNSKKPSNPNVGYGNPPKEHQFKKGQSGNPNGRPKGSKNKADKSQGEKLARIIKEEAYRSININENEETHSIPIVKAIVRSLAVNAAKGEVRSQKLMFDLLKGAEIELHEDDDSLHISINFV